MAGDDQPERGDGRPAADLDALIDGSLVTPTTRAALRRRLTPRETPRLLDEPARALLGAVCRRLVPHGEDLAGEDLAGADFASEDLAGAVEAKFVAGDGWRYDALPPDGQALRLGLAGIGEAARALFGRDFAGLAAADQDAVLALVQRGEAPGAAWARLPAPRFFEELLAAAAEAAYAHPAVQAGIGYLGFADARGWRQVGLDAPPEAPEPGAGEAR